VVAVSAHPTQDIIASGALDNDRTVRLWKPRLEELNFDDCNISEGDDQDVANSVSERSESDI